MKIPHLLICAGLCAVVALTPGDAAERYRGGARAVAPPPVYRPAAVPMSRPVYRPPVVHPNPVVTGAVHGPYGNVAIAPRQVTIAPAARPIEHAPVVIGPNRNVHAGGVVATGPRGTALVGNRAAVVVSPNRGVVADRRGAVGVGPYGTVGVDRRGAVAVGPRGAIYHGTRYVGVSGLRGQGAYIRNNFRYYNAFRPDWYRRYPGAWYPGGAWWAWAAPAWATWAGIVGYADSVAPFVYDYGDNITYQDGTVYYADQPAGTEQQYADEASAIAARGQQDPGPGAVWQPLGVFAVARGDENNSDETFELAMDQNGILRGNYYNAAANTVTPVKGALDKPSQRVAWTVGGAPYPVYEAGMYNLTQDQTTMLVHFSRDDTEQYRLFRIPPPAPEQGPQP